jgi:two-component system sensor histidine kinase AgrC
LLSYVLLSFFAISSAQNYIFFTIYNVASKKELLKFCCFNILVYFFLVFSLYSFFQLTSAIHKQKLARKEEQMKLEESLRLIHTLEGQRHDYRNQLNVIRLLSETNRSDDVVTYIDDIVHTSRKESGQAYDVGNSAVSAMLMVYSAEAKNKEIEFVVESDINFSTYKYSPVKTTRILGNIIRNAIEVLDRIKMEGRLIRITMWDSSESFTFLIWNNGPPIPPDRLEQIFAPGVSGKQSTGFGLYVVKKLVDELAGEISLKSTREDGTEFRVVLPRIKKQAADQSQATSLVEVSQSI